MPDRIGLVGYNCASGLGEKNRQLATHLDIDCWLIKPHGSYPTLPLHEDVDSIVCPSGNITKLNDFLKSVDIVLFDETPYYLQLTGLAKQAGKRIVCIACQEWMPIPGTPWLSDVDLFVCPTQHCYDLYHEELPCVYFPWPIDTERFTFKQRTEVKRFLFINGRGGWHQRKGSDIIREAFKLWPELPLDYYSQTPLGLPARQLPSPENNADLYSRGDVLLSPHTMDGTGLEQMEALASGMPVVNTNGRPWNEIPSLAYIPSTKTTVRIKRQVEWYTSSPEKLVQLCGRLIGADITQESLSGRQWAESRSFNNLSQSLTSLIRQGRTNETREGTTT